MTPLRQRMIEDMQLRGLAPATQQAYLRAVKQFALYYGKSPDQITAEQLRAYFLGSTVQVVQTWYTNGHGFSNSDFA